MARAAEQIVPKRDLHARRIKFHYSPPARDRHYVQGDLVMSHVVSMLSAMFPEGEDFFVRSVRAHAHQIADPELARQVRGFVGQEVTHGREHRSINETLAEMGFRTRGMDRYIHHSLALIERIWSPRVCLAITAALEHYTATLAETLLSDPAAQELLGDNEVRSLLLWHALEESEHKAVAFDVYQQVYGDETIRIRSMQLISIGFWVSLIAWTAYSLAWDRATYHPTRLVRSLARLRHSPFLKRAVLRRLRRYDQRGFHPDDFDAAELLARWRTELFGEDGMLRDHLR
ncbi:MAG: metal-dependent hydrolase [Jatrophihabitans sp.]|uniref:metal-dependent hydrolase n=1 Tax=Jatrophihabitans sp. TaxID=1932789 RepID=UPI00390E5E92